MIISSTSGHACEDTQHKYPYMHDGHLLRLKFSQNVYELRTMTDGHGTLQATHTSGLPGDTVTLTPVPDPKYTFTGYQSTGCTINGNTLTFGAQDCTAKANFYKPPGPVYVGNIDGKLAKKADCFLIDYDSVLRGQDGIDTYVSTYPSIDTFNYGFVYGDCGQPFVDLMKTNSAYMFYNGTVSAAGGHTMWSTKNTLSLNPESAYIRINSAPVSFRASGSYCAFTASYNGNSFTGNLGPYSAVRYDLAQYFDFSHLANRPIVSFNFKPASTQFKSISITGERWNGDFYKIE